MRILLVEDDPQLGDGLTIGLRQAGFAVDWLKDGNSADQALQRKVSISSCSTSACRACPAWRY
jgi:DNA-binding response OmpR family regulator